MTQRLRGSPSWRVPEPQQIVAWFASLWPRVRAYAQRSENRVFWGIVLLAATLRLGYLHLAEFGLLHVQNLRASTDIVTQGRLPLVGAPSALGVPNPPLFNYLLLLPAWLGRDPRLSVALVSLLHVAAVAGLYGLALRYYGRRVAVVASLLYAVNPWAVVISRQLVAESLFAPFGVLLAYGLCRALLDRWPWGWAIAGITIIALLQLSWMATPLALAFASLLLLYRGRVRWLHLLLGLCFGLVLAMPYLYHLNATRLADLGALLRATNPSHSALSRLRPIALATWIQSGWRLAELAGASVRLFRPASALWHRLDWAAAGLFLACLPGLAFLGVDAWSRWKDRRDPAQYFLLVVWLWTPLLWLTLRPRPLGPADLSLLYPAGFIAIGLVLDAVFAIPDGDMLRRFWWSPVVRIALWLGFAVLPLWQIYNVLYLHDFVIRHDTSGGYVTPYRAWEQTASMALREARARGVDTLWVVAEGTDTHDAEQPAILDYMLGAHVHLVFLGQDGIETAVLPAARSALYLTTRTAGPADRLLQLLQQEERGLVVFPGGRKQARLRWVSERRAEELVGLARYRGLWAFDSGARLIGLDWPQDARAGQPARVATYWTFQGVPAQERDTRQSFVLELVAPDGHAFGRREGFGLPPAYWEDGLLLVQWMDLPIPEAAPAGEYPLRARMLRGENRIPQQMIDEQGRDAGREAVLGQFAIGR